MREIKFRAWDREQKCMVSWEQLMDVRYNERWFVDNTDKNYINCIFTDQDYTLEQFTGLLDKNNQEIYEGDILDFDEKEWGGKFDPEAILIEKMIGKWDLCGSVDDVGSWRSIIGNIHQHPELLGKK